MIGVSRNEVARDGRFTWITADVTDAASVDELFAKVAREQQRLDVLVNCVGQSDRGLIQTLGVERLGELFATNVTSALLCCQAALPMLRESKGVVVNIGSLASKVAARHLGAYPAVKHALAGLTQQLRLEWREYGIHVGLVSPGPIRRADAGQRYQSATSPAGLPPGAMQPGGGTSIRGLAPERVAEAVLRCVTKRKPDIILPGYTRALIVIGHAWPRLGDWLLLRMTST